MEAWSGTAARLAPGDGVAADRAPRAQAVTACPKVASLAEGAADWPVTDLPPSRQTSTISVILLTHPTLAHVGAYAHCCRHVPLFSRIPVYATAPVISLGRTLLQDLYASTPLAASLLPPSAVADSSPAFTAQATPTPTDMPNILLQPPSNDDIASYFSIINPLKYSQPHQPLASPSSPLLDGLTVTAYASGHTLGGTMWHIQYASESVVYAVDWNHARENLLSGAAWLSSGTGGAEVIEQLRKPTALVCSSKGAEEDSLAGGWKKRDDLLLDHIRSTVAKGASVLIPCDTSARCLELAYLLERAFLRDAAPFHGAVPYLASRTCSATIRYARSMLEWMDESVVREFESHASSRQGANTQREGPGSEPFNFEYLKLVERPTQLHRALSTQGPKIFLASDASMDWGFSRDILKKLGADQSNLLILTDRPLHDSETSVNGRSESDDSTLADSIRKLFIDKKSPDGIVQCSDDGIEVKTHTIEPLGPNDQEYYQQWLARQRQRQDAAPADKASNLEATADVVDDQSDSTSSSEAESDDEHQGKVLNVSNALTHSKHKLGLTDEELGINVLLRRKNVHDFDVRGKRGREKMFPFVAKRQRRDEFGDVIRPEEYLRAEEKEDLENQDTSKSGDKTETAVGQKRRWDARGATRGDAIASGPGKRRKGAEGTDGERQGMASSGSQVGDGDQSDESEYEPDEPAVVGPTKVSFGSETFHISVRIAAVDYSSIHDRRSLRMLIPLIAPRKVILTGGKARETDFLADECRRMLGKTGQTTTDSPDVFTPINGVTVEASVDTNAWTIKLSRSLYKNLQWQVFRGLGIVTVDGQVEAAQPDETSDSASKRQRLDEKEEGRENVQPETAAPVLNVIAAGVAGPSRSIAQSLHVGDLRLAELRRILQATGHLAEFKGEGTLLVDGIVAVRKNGVGRIEVESGWLSGQGPRAPRAGASFFNVKRKIYEGLAVVAAK
ncbi:hypothetical protein FH972_022950 [Carpinus fangiana]|uniref:Cleavage and polyadenylation specificity factor subunit 2 n=1 Tax=Carpinus fangiana TaxID=176857 RepID=A0A5N6KVZ8_9ROSI|nr:hypothetical protein FH972_022950 [Carpinus fangiana]